MTHGTDTIIETAQFVEKELLKKKDPSKICKTIIFTGSFLPEAFKDSDADFNLGLSIGAIQATPKSLDKNRVFVALNGLLIPAWKAARKEDGSFMCKALTIFS